MGRPTQSVCATRTLFFLRYELCLLLYWNEPIDGRNLDIISMINEYMTSQSFSNLVYDSYKATSIIFISLEMNYLITQLVDHTDYFTIVKTGTQLVGYFTTP